MFIRISIFILFFLLVGCAQKIIITPDTLPDAVLGKPYYAEVKIDGGAISPSVYSTVTPENNLIVEPIRTGSSYNTMKIYGKPIEATDTVILIHGGTYGTMVSGKEFKKTYTLKVKEQE